MAGPKSKEAKVKPTPEVDTRLAQIREDDRFFAGQLDLIPRALLVPKTDEQRLEKYEKQQERSKDKRAKQDENDKDGGQKKKRRFDIKSNEEALMEATRQQKQENEDMFKTPTHNNNKITKKALNEASLAELKLRLVSKIEEQRKKGGVPGTRAERDKLLPPKPPRPIREKLEKTGEEPDASESIPQEEEGANDDATANKKKSKKEELEAKLSFGLVKIDESKIVPDKPARSATSMNSIINVKKLIKKAEESQARMETLKQQGKTDVVQAEKWDILEKKAAGEKVRDDPKLLKKSLKRLEKSKVKSAKGWQDRKSQEKKEQRETADSKKSNVEERRVKKIEKRGGQVKRDKDDTTPMKKRRPGFEGSRNNFSKDKKGGAGGGFNKGGKRSFSSSAEGGDKKFNKGKSPFAASKKVKHG